MLKCLIYSIFGFMLGFIICFGLFDRNGGDDL